MPQTIDLRDFDPLYPETEQLFNRLRGSGTDIELAKIFIRNVLYVFLMPPDDAEIDLSDFLNARETDKFRGDDGLEAFTLLVTEKHDRRMDGPDPLVDFIASLAAALLPILCEQAEEEELHNANEVISALIEHESEWLGAYHAMFKPIFASTMQLAGGLNGGSAAKAETLFSLMIRHASSDQEDHRRSTLEGFLLSAIDFVVMLHGKLKL